MNVYQAIKWMHRHPNEEMVDSDGDMWRFNGTSFEMKQGKGHYFCGDLTVDGMMHHAFTRLKPQAPQKWLKYTTTMAWHLHGAMVVVPKEMRIPLGTRVRVAIKVLP